MDQPPDLKALEKAREKRRRSRERAERKRKVLGRITGITHLVISSSFMWKGWIFPWSLHPTSSHPCTPSSSSSRHLYQEEVLIIVHYRWVQKKKIIHVLIFTIPPPLSSCAIPQGIKECRKDLFMATLAWKPSNALDWRAWACSVISFISHPRHHKQHRSQSAVIPTEHGLNDCCLPESCCCCGCLALSQTLLKDLSKYFLHSTALVCHRVAATVLKDL